VKDRRFSFLCESRFKLITIIRDLKFLWKFFLVLSKKKISTKSFMGLINFFGGLNKWGALSDGLSCLAFRPALQIYGPHVIDTWQDTNKKTREEKEKSEVKNSF
jgi:hypothetical protein